ncbi:MAG TPA: 50S ribosomal protein L3 [Patescibacteria group bacterium]
MVTAVFAEKLGMTHVYNDKNRHIPVTILRVAPQVVTALRTQEKDGYAAIQVGATGRKHVAKPQAEELKKSNIELPISHRKEIRIEGEADMTVGQEMNVTIFAAGDKVMITGISKGKGFAGTIKRHNFSRGPETHGSKNVRKPGSIGGGYPQRVVLGKRMSGHMGHETVTTKGHKVVAINEKDNTIAISGAVPGPNKGRVFIQKVEK